MCLDLECVRVYLLDGSRDFERVVLGLLGDVDPRGASGSPRLRGRPFTVEPRERTPPRLTRAGADQGPSPALMVGRLELLRGGSPRSPGQGLVMPWIGVDRLPAAVTEPSDDEVRWIRA